MKFSINILIFIIFTINLYASKIEIKIFSEKIENANVVLITAETINATNIKAISSNKEIDFLTHPFKENSYYALVPFHYYMDKKQHQIIISYSLSNKEYFEEYFINLVEGNYDQEEIKLTKSKVSLNKNSKKRVSKEYKEAMNVYNYVTPKNYWYDDFVLPMNSEITSKFGTKRVYNNKIKSYHTGIDFKSEINSDVQASNNGIVKITKNRFYAGNSIIIDHGHGIYSCYYHLNKIFVTQGDFVQRGDIIGLSGNTGRTTGPHLHFATFVNGIQINPTKLFETLNSLNN